MNLMVTVFTAWGYEISLLELLAFVTSLTGVSLGVFGPRITWPFWSISSLLYAALFFQWNYYSILAENINHGQSCIIALVLELLFCYKEQTGLILVIGSRCNI